MKSGHHRGFLQPHNRGVRQSGSRGHTLQLGRQAAFTEEVACAEYCDDGLFAGLRHDGNLDLAFLDMKDRVGRIALRENDFTLLEIREGASPAVLGEKRSDTKF